MSIPYSKIARLVQSLQKTGASKATCYVSETETIKVTRMGKLDRRASRTELRVTFGRPNWAERQFIKACKRAGEPFPIKKVQLRMPRA